MPACFWQPSAWLTSAQGLLALLAALAVAGSAVPQPFRIALVLFCLGWACRRLLRARNRDRLRARYRLGLRHVRGSGWELWQPSSGWQPVRIGAGSLVTRYVVVVYCVTARGRRLSLVIPADVLDADSHRRLRLWLRLNPLSGKVAG